MSMQLETTAGNLRSALACINGVVERKNSVPILGSVRIGNGRVTATDLDMAASVTLPQIGNGKGEMAIDCRTLSGLAAHIPADEVVSISEDDGLAKVGFNGSEYRLCSYPAADFPEFKEVSGAQSKVGNAGIVEALRRVRFAVSTEETRYYLNGVAFLADDGQAHVAATDGHRLAIAPIPFMPEGAAGKIIPAKAVSYLTARKAEPKSVVFAEEPRARFDFEGLTVATKLVDGTFPDIWRVVPKETTDYMTVDRAAMLTVLRRINSILNPFDRAGVKLVGDGASLTIERNGAETKCREAMAASLSDGSFEVGFNCQYLITALSGLRGETVTFSARAGEIGGSPTIIKSADDDLRIVQMPMRV